MAGGTNKISERQLRAVLDAPRDKELSIPDGEGLSARVLRTGSISWMFTYRLGGGRTGKQERLRLGNYPDMSLKLARERRRQCREWLAAGRDPRRQLDQTIEKSLKPVTVKEALEYWLENYAKDKRTDYAAIQSQFATYIYPYIGNIALEETDTQHWLSPLDAVDKKHAVTAGRLLQICKQALKYCYNRNYARCSALNTLTVKEVGKDAGQRDRVLTNTELAEIWNSFNDTSFDQYTKTLIRLMLVFGCRTRELRLSRWDEWDLKAWVWTTPPSKNDSKIVRPIPYLLRDWLSELHQRKKNELLLGEEKSQSTVSQKGRSLYKRFNHVERWTFHDFRRAVSTHMANMGIPPHITETILGHKLNKIMLNYNYSDYLPEKLDAFNKWCDRLELISGNHKNVYVLKDGSK